MSALKVSSSMEDSLNFIKYGINFVEKEIDAGNSLEAIQRCNEMLSELKSSKLPPKSYYELFTDTLRNFQLYLLEKFKNGERIDSYYEIVQYSNDILPRLYMLITVGIVNIKSNKSMKKEIITDLVEMCRGVQHPLRGLFLRSYLLQSLDSSILVHETEDQICSLKDSIGFILTNFAEMNKLWVRMQHQGHTRNKQTRENERRDLRLLVGTNITRLAQFEYVTCEFYASEILPFILEQICSCDDFIAQEYLMDIIIQVFPEEFHIATLDKLMEACTMLDPSVPLRPILCSLIDRLGIYELNLVKENREPDLKPISHDWPSIPCNNINDQKALDDMLEQLIDIKFNHTSTSIIKYLSTEIAQMLLRTRPEQLSVKGISSIDVVIIYQSLLNLAQNLFLGKSFSWINYFLRTVAILLRFLGEEGATNEMALAIEILTLLNQPLDPNSLINEESGRTSRCQSPGQGIGKMLTSRKVPNEAICSMQQILDMEGFRELANLLDPINSRRMAKHVIFSALEQDHLDKENNESTRLVSESVLDGLFNLIKILIKPLDDINLRSLNSRVASNDASEEILDELNALAGVLHLLGPEPIHKDTNLTFNLLKKSYEVLRPGGQTVIKICFPALIFQTIMLLQAYKHLLIERPYSAMSDEDKEQWDKTVYSTVEFCHKLISQLINCESLETALRCYLDCALAVDFVEFNKRDSSIYEFLSRAIYLCEERIRDAKAQPNALLSIIACLLDLKNLNEKDHSTLRIQSTRSAGGLLRRSDQTKVVANCALLYWQSTPRPENAPPILPQHPDDDDDEDKKTSVSRKPLRNSSEVLKCLDRSYELANECVDTNTRVQLFIDLLNINARFRVEGCSEVSDERIQQLVNLSNSIIVELDENDRQQVLLVTYFTNTIDYLRSRQNSDSAIFSGINLPVK